MTLPRSSGDQISPALIDEDSRSSGIRLACGGGYCRTPQWRLTTRCHGYIVSDNTTSRAKGATTEISEYSGRYL